MTFSKKVFFSLWKVLGNHTEFQRVASLLQDTVDFDIDVNASVFETNIRGTEGGGYFLCLAGIFSLIVNSLCVCVRLCVCV